MFLGEGFLEVELVLDHIEDDVVFPFGEVGLERHDGVDMLEIALVFVLRDPVAVRDIEIGEDARNKAGIAIAVHALGPVGPDPCRPTDLLDTFFVTLVADVAVHKFPDVREGLPQIFPLQFLGQKSRVAGGFTHHLFDKLHRVGHARPVFGDRVAALGLADQAIIFDGRFRYVGYQLPPLDDMDLVVNHREARGAF